MIPTSPNLPHNTVPIYFWADKHKVRWGQIVFFNTWWKMRCNTWYGGSLSTCIYQYMSTLSRADHSGTKPLVIFVFNGLEISTGIQSYLISWRKCKICQHQLKWLIDGKCYLVHKFVCPYPALWIWPLCASVCKEKCKIGQIMMKTGKTPHKQ